MKRTAYTKGVLAEQKILWLLKSDGYEIIGTRIKTKYGEIDILAKKELNIYII
jgi:Holliday junction resolvase-like predicted endonuclease